MKIIYIFFILSIVFLSCDESTDTRKYDYPWAKTAVIDNCEYIIDTGNRVTHKGNCVFCERRKAKADSILIQNFIKELQRVLQR